MQGLIIHGVHLDLPSAPAMYDPGIDIDGPSKCGLKLRVDLYHVLNALGMVVPREQISQGPQKDGSISLKEISEKNSVPAAIDVMGQGGILGAHYVVWVSAPSHELYESTFSKTVMIDDIYSPDKISVDYTIPEHRITLDTIKDMRLNVQLRSLSNPKLVETLHDKPVVSDCGWTEDSRSLFAECVESLLTLKADKMIQSSQSVDLVLTPLSVYAAPEQPKRGYVMVHTTLGEAFEYVKQCAKVFDKHQIADTAPMNPLRGCESLEQLRAKKKTTHFHEQLLEWATYSASEQIVAPRVEQANAEALQQLLAAAPGLMSKLKEMDTVEVAASGPDLGEQLKQILNPHPPQPFCKEVQDLVIFSVPNRKSDRLQSTVTQMQVELPQKLPEGNAKEWWPMFVAAVRNDPLTSGRKWTEKEAISIFVNAVEIHRSQCELIADGLQQAVEDRSISASVAYAEKELSSSHWKLISGGDEPPLYDETMLLAFSIFRSAISIAGSNLVDYKSDSIQASPHLQSGTDSANAETVYVKGVNMQPAETMGSDPRLMAAVDRQVGARDDCEGCTMTLSGIIGQMRYECKNVDQTRVEGCEAGIKSRSYRSGSRCSKGTEPKTDAQLLDRFHDAVTAMGRFVVDHRVLLTVSGAQISDSHDKDQAAAPGNPTPVGAHMATFLTTAAAAATAFQNSEKYTSQRSLPDIKVQNTSNCIYSESYAPNYGDHLFCSGTWKHLPACLLGHMVMGRQRRGLNKLGKLKYAAAEFPLVISCENTGPTYDIAWQTRMNVANSKHNDNMVTSISQGLGAAIEHLPLQLKLQVDTAFKEAYTESKRSPIMAGAMSNLRQPGIAHSGTLEIAAQAKTVADKTVIDGHPFWRCLVESSVGTCFNHSNSCCISPSEKAKMVGSSTPPKNNIRQFVFGFHQGTGKEEKTAFRGIPYTMAADPRAESDWLSGVVPSLYCGKESTDKETAYFFRRQIMHGIPMPHPDDIQSPTPSLLSTMVTSLNNTMLAKSTRTNDDQPYTRMQFTIGGTGANDARSVSIVQAELELLAAECCGDIKVTFDQHVLKDFGILGAGILVVEIPESLTDDEKRCEGIYNATVAVAEGSRNARYVKVDDTMTPLPLISRGDTEFTIKHLSECQHIANIGLGVCHDHTMHQKLLKQNTCAASAATVNTAQTSISKITNTVRDILSAPPNAPNVAGKVTAKPKVNAKTIAKAKALAKMESVVKAQTQLQMKNRENVSAKTAVEAKAINEAKAQAAVEAKAIAKIRANSKAAFEAKAVAQAAAQAKAQAAIQAQAAMESKAIAQVRAKSKAAVEAKAIAQAQAQAQAAVEAQVRAKAKAAVEAQAQAVAAEKAQAQVVAAVEAQAIAQAQAAVEAKAAVEAQVRAKAKAAVEAQAQVVAAEKAQAIAQVKAQAQAAAQAQVKAQVRAKAKAAVEAQAQAVAQAKVEAQVKSQAIAQAKAIVNARAKLEATVTAAAKAAVTASVQVTAKAAAPAVTLGHRSKVGDKTTISGVGYETSNTLLNMVNLLCKSPSMTTSVQAIGEKLNVSEIEVEIMCDSSVIQLSTSTGRQMTQALLELKANNTIGFVDGVVQTYLTTNSARIFTES